LKGKKRNIYLFPFLIAIILRCAAIPILDESEPALMEYGRIAHNMLTGSGFSYSWYHTSGTHIILPTAYMPPGQVFIQYFILGVFGETNLGLIALYFLQIVQFLVFLYLIGQISRLLFRSERAENFTIWLAAIYPPFIYISMTFGVTSSALLLNALVLYFGIRFSHSLGTNDKTMKFALLLGISCGFLLLFRGESPLIIITTFILIIYQNKDELRRAVLYIGLAGLTAAAILAPWTIRNYLAFHRFIPISTNGGFNFWRGNNAITTGSPWAESGSPLWTTDSLWAEIEPKMDTSKDFDKIYSDIHVHDAVHWIKEHPLQAALLSVKKAAILWTVDMKSKMGRTVAYIMIYFLTSLALLSGIFFIYKNKIAKTSVDARIGLQIIILWCIIATMTAMIFFPLPRFQVLLIGIYFPIVGYGISEIAAHLFERKQGK
jgi:hypothetical protein